MAYRAVFLVGAALSLAGALIAQQPSATTGDGVFSEEQAAGGAELYQQTCMKCHGPSLAGSDMVPALTGPKFATDWNGATVADLYDRIRLSMPADMPATLDRGEAIAAAAYLLRANGMPSGKQDLPSDPARLRTIKIAGLK